MKNLRDLKFASKVMLGLFIPLFIFCITLGIYMLNRITADFNTKIDEKGHTVTKLLAKFSAITIITYDHWTLEEYISEVMKDKEIVFAVIKDKKNKPLTSTVFRENDTRTDKPKIYITPVYHNNKVVGEVEVHIATAHFKATLIHDLLFFGGIIIGAVILCYITSYLISAAATKPLKEMAEHMKQVEHGDYSIRQAVESADEIGSLAKGFNEMLDDLERRNKEITWANEQLEQKMEERRLMEKQLRQAQKLEAIGTLAGGIAHDFNNILTTIIGYSQLLMLKKAEDDPEREKIETVFEAAEKATELVRQLLAFSRKQVMDIRVVNLNYIVTNVSKMLTRLIGENIAIKTTLNESIGNIKADPGQVEQVIVNLVVNARDAMPDGGELYLESDSVELDEEYCKTHANIVPGQYVVFSVTDTGVGIPPELRDKIFDPFFTTKKAGEGTGLGLATVYGIVTQMDGHIYVYSEVGHGTTFKIYFPEVAEKVDAKSKQKVSLTTGKETILVVDDETAILRLL
ncbi:MAG: HAMP domain-containing protein, partial [Deltaproteobacteria bacterium]|nr:HAMP domain-containing protein [Deltaproteobacteria bacterium]